MRFCFSSSFIKFASYFQITVLSPDLRNNKQIQDQARLTKENHLEWVVTLQSGEQKDLFVKWQAEFPLNESVVYSMGSGKWH
jgi:uncharacterized membrane protein YbjE (DUF340 family)